MALQRASAPSRAATKLLELGLLLVVPLVFHRGFSEQFTSIKRFLTEGLIIAAAAILAIHLIWGAILWPKNLKLSAPLCLVTISVLISCMRSPVPKFSLVEATAFLSGPVWLIFLATSGGGERQVRWLAALMTIAGTGMAGIALLQWAGYDPLVFGGYQVEWGAMRNAMRLYSTLGNPNFVAGYLIGAIFLALALAGTASSAAGKVVASASAITMFAAIMGTRSRGAWLGLAAGFLVARVVGRKKTPSAHTTHPGDTRIQLGLWVPPAVVLALLPEVTNLAQTLAARFEARAFLWSAGWPMFAEHPLAGSGWGTFQLRFPELQAHYLAVHPELIRFWTHTSQLHNDPLQILYEAGAVGLTAFAWLLWRYARTVREEASVNDGASRVWLGASAGGVVAIVLNSLLNIQFSIPSTLILLFTLLSIPSLLGCSPPHPDSGTEKVNAPARRIVSQILATVLVLTASWALAVNLWTRAVSDHALALGMEQERRGAFLRAETHFRGGLEKSPDDGRLHYGLARALFVQGRHAEALAHVLRAERTVADAHLEVLRARLIDQLGYGSPALAAYRHALWLNPRLRSVPADIKRLTESGPEAVQ